MKFFIFVFNSERFWPKTSFIEALFSRSDKLRYIRMLILPSGIPVA
jgi:hypothetical protein